MFRLMVSGIRARKTRFLLSAIAVALGVAFMVGTLVLTDTMRRSYDGTAAAAAKGTDAFVRSSRVVTDPDQGTESRGKVDDTTLAAVRAVPGVAAAEPRVEGIAQLLRADGHLLDDNANRRPPLALAWSHDADLNPMRIVAGREPSAANEIVVDRKSARTGHIHPGDSASVVTKAGRATYVVAGIATYGGADNNAGAQVIAFMPATASKVLGTRGHYDGVLVKGPPHMSQGTLRAHITAALRQTRDVEVITGATMVAEAKATAHENMTFLTTFLFAFGVVALLVGSFVIANISSITVAQRTKENALTRAIGASRRQVLGAVLLEAAVTGLVASGLGILLGIGTAIGLRALLGGFGLALPTGPMIVSVRTIVISAVVGTTVAIGAALLPARRASRIPPIAAMRDVAMGGTGSSARRTAIGVAVTALGAALVGAGLGGAGIAALGVGAILVFVGVAVLGPVIARRAARIIGAPLAQHSSAGSLARQNAARNPRRTAATASALTIGVGLVVFMTIFAASTKTSVAAKVDRAVRGDWIVSTQWGQGGVSPKIAERIDALPETAAVTGFRYAPAAVDGHQANVSAFDPAKVDRLIDLDVKSGDIDQLATGGLAVQIDVAKDKGWVVGDRVSVNFPETGARRLPVVAIYNTEEPMGSYAVSLATYDANVTAAVDHYVVIANTPGVPNDRVRAAVDRVLVGYPTAELQTNAEFRGSLLAGIDQQLTLVYALLLVAVIIALLGIANTLALSVHERTREIGFLRAIGMSRRQVRSMVRRESVIIALLGTGLGLVIGFGFGWALVHALADKGLHQLTVPVAQLGIIVAVGGIAGMTAAVAPARRASRLDVLTALRTD